MSEFIQTLINTPAFYFITGIVLIGLFIWYLSSEEDRTKRNAGAAFIIGLSAFSLMSLFVNGINYGIDISGGVELTLEVQPKIDDRGREVPPEATEMQQACDILNERLNATGTSEVQIIHSGNKILIQIPMQDKDETKNKEKIDAMVKTLTKMAKLELLKVDENEAAILATPEAQQVMQKYLNDLDNYRKQLEEYREKQEKGEYTRAPRAPRTPLSYFGGKDTCIYPHPLLNDKTGKPMLDKEGKPIIDFRVLEKPSSAEKRGVYITGANVSKASPNYAERGMVNVTLNNDGAERMARLTGKMQLGRDRMAVVLNSQVKCAPVVQAVLHKDFQITGLNGVGEPEDISKALANPLSSDLKVLGRKDVSAQLGKSALQQGEIGGIVGMIAIFFFCYWYYRWSGMVAMVGLTINALILLGLMSLFGFVLTLPGIAGIVLTMGVAVDANVLIYERMREERKLGRPFITCLRNAYEKAFSAIWDSNITSLITAVILFWLASGSIKGFAVTTSVGIITSLIGAIVVTRVIFFIAEHLGLIKDDFTFAHAPLEDRTFDFMKWRKVAMVCSSLFIIICIVAAAIRGKDALGIDFTGGSSITYTLSPQDQVDFKSVEKAVENIKLSKTASVQEFKAGDVRSIQVRFVGADEPEHAAGQDTKAGEKEAAMIDATLREKVPGMKDLAAPKLESVSASLGSSFFKTAMWALLAAMIGITMYLALRFEWSFAMGALITIFHDVLAIIGLVILIGSELSIIHIGAFLTVAGYSINDTIVIYDRIRERLRLADEKEPLIDIMNESISSTMSRTILTGLSTLACLTSLLAFGGPAMRDFSVTMLLGVIIGTYSSVYISSTAVLYFSRRGDLRRELAEADSVSNQP